MPKWMTAAFAMFLSLQVFNTKGESVDGVVNKYIDAMGGRDKLVSIRSIYKEGFYIGKTGEMISTVHCRVQDNPYPLFDYISEGTKIDLAGKENVNGLDCYKLVLTLLPGHTVDYLIDSKNWYIIREIRRMPVLAKPGINGKDSEVVVDYSNYRKNQEGYIFPYQETSTLSFPETIKYTNIIANNKTNMRLYKSVCQ